MSFYEYAAPHLFSLFAFNCFKTVLGAGFVGRGVRHLLAKSPEEDVGGDDDGRGGDAKADGDASSLTNPGGKLAGWYEIFSCKYVRASATVGLGLVLAVPAVASQVALEAMIPRFLVTDIGYDVAAGNVREMLPEVLQKRFGGD